ncbi:MAG: DsbA family protein [Pseudomonadota bacterium]
MSKIVKIEYYSDLLCVWAYIAQVKLDELKQEFGDRISIDYRFVSLFGNNAQRIGEGFEEGGFSGYSEHVKNVAANFDYVEVHPDIWTRNIPPSSLPAHLYLKAVQSLEAANHVSRVPQARFGGRSLFEQFIWQLRRAFFRDVENISEKPVLRRHAELLGLPVDAIDDEIVSGRAFACLASDIDEKERRMIEGSPTFILNEGRQKLYGNIGYRAIAANIRELMERKLDIPDWC